MAVAVVADAHLGGPGGDAGPLIAQLEALPARGCRHLVLLGDIFHIWIGAPQFETPEICALLPVLRRLRQAGIAIDYVEGNRDFYLQKSPYTDAFDRIAYEVAFEVGGVRYLAVHGDGLNDRDRKYRFWRWLSKSWLVRLLVLRLPAALARRFVGSTEKRLAETNFKHRRRIPEEAISRYATWRLADSADVLLLGHFHTPRRWQVEGGEIRLLDAWFNSRQVEWIADDRRADRPQDTNSCS